LPLAEVNGIHVYYEIHGKGESLVVIPGLSIDITALEKIVSELSKNYQVIVFDNRGAGRSDKPDIPYTIEMMADDTSGLLNSLKIERANIMGISMGGRIAITLTLKHPEFVRSLILVSTCASVPNTLSRRLIFLFLEIPRRIGTLGKKYPQPNYAYQRQRKASQNYDASTRLNEIHVPTLILQGERDRLAPYVLAEQMHKGIVESKIVTFNGGHMFFLWRQKEFIDVVENFLQFASIKAEG
jgi:3-oxoadipate enol-lactonase